MAINTFQANILQLITENVEVRARPMAEAAIRDRLSELLLRLKNPANYAGQAGRNIYEDVSPSADGIAGVVLRNKAIHGHPYGRLVQEIISGYKL